tara:strand:- start:2201 stop:2467 length:267 start_codon:yes stop_codon:yes gene_type:complete
MNGRQAKKLRALAGVNKQNRNSRHYEGVEHTLRKHSVYHPTLTEPNGKRKVVAVVVQTMTARMSQSARLLNKTLKKQFKAKQGIFAFA